MEKSQLRKEYFRQYKYHKNTEEMQIILTGLKRNITRFFRNKNPSRIMAYHPLPSELPVLSLLGQLELEIFIPKLRETTLQPVSTITGKYDKLYNMDYIIVPGLFVTKSGYRLGRGRGFYDRILCTYPRFRSIFVCQSWQVLKEIPTDPWDKRVGFILTENNIRMCF